MLQNSFAPTGSCARGVTSLSPVKLGHDRCSWTRPRSRMGCGASSAKPAELSPPARAAAAKSKLEELKNPKSVAPAASGQAAIDPRLQQDNRAALGTSATPAVKKYALTEDFYKPHTPSVRACESNPVLTDPFLKRCCRWPGRFQIRPHRRPEQGRHQRALPKARQGI